MAHPFVDYLVARDLVPANVSRHLSGVNSLVREPIGMIAVAHGLLRANQIDLILDAQRKSSERFGEIAVAMGFLTPVQVEHLIRIQDFRTAGAICEALILAEVLAYEDAFRYLGAYLAGDPEMMAMIAQEGPQATSLPV